MTLETPQAYELRTMPEVFNTIHRKPYFFGKTKRDWLIESRKEHDEKMNDPAYRQKCIENEKMLKEWEKGNELI